MSKSQPTYAGLKAELDDIMLELQREDLDVDKALVHYQRGLELVKALEKHLKTAENKIKQIKATFKDSSQ